MSPPLDTPVFSSLGRISLPLTLSEAPASRSKETIQHELPLSPDCNSIELASKNSAQKYTPSSSTDATLKSPSDLEKDLSDKATTTDYSPDDTDSKQETTGDSLQNIVEFNGPNDPIDPRNWNRRRKWLVTVIVSLFTFIS